MSEDMTRAVQRAMAHVVGHGDPHVCGGCGQRLEVGDWPHCPHGRGRYNVIADSIPGGMVLENLGAKPITVYSHSERRFAMQKAGVVEAVRHVGAPGSDKSPHTTKWT